MRWKIFDGEALVNIIEAQEAFCESYCQGMGYTYELIPEDEPGPIILYADRDYEPGELLSTDDALYKVLLPIFSGTQLTVGTNVEVTTIEAEIAKLNEGVS